MSGPLLFALDPDGGLGEGIARRLGLPLAGLEERSFEDGEHKLRPLESVRGRDVYVLHSLCADGRRSPNDKLCRLLFFLGALRDSGAGRLTALVPYLCYARKDRQTKWRDPVTTRYVAQLFEAVGVDCVVVLDVHNLAAFQNAFRCRTVHLEARKLFVAEALSLVSEDEKLVVVSPDAGGVKRAEAFRSALAARAGREVPMAFVEKYRSAGVVSGDAVVGEVGGRAAFVVDDMIGTGGTMVRAAQGCLARGSARVYALATHGLFNRDAAEVLADRSIDGVVVTDSVPAERLPSDGLGGRLKVLGVAPLLAEAVSRLHGDGSIVGLLS